MTPLQGSTAGNSLHGFPVPVPSGTSPSPQSGGFSSTGPDPGERLCLAKHGSPLPVEGSARSSKGRVPRLRPTPGRTARPASPRTRSRTSNGCERGPQGVGCGLAAPMPVTSVIRLPVSDPPSRWAPSSKAALSAANPLPGVRQHPTLCRCPSAPPGLQFPPPAPRTASAVQAVAGVW